MSDFENQQDEIEALQSIFTEEEFHCLKDTESIRGQFNAFVSVPEGFTVFYRKIDLPRDDCTLNDDNEDAKKSGESKTFEKTVSIKYLPPVSLCFQLPADYPSQSAPVYKISCPWLTHFQLRKLSRRLLKIWTENKGFVVLYSWAQFLKDECLSFLNVEKSLDVAAVEEARSGKLLNGKKRPEQFREALTNMSNKQEEIPVVEETRERNLKMKEEVCTVVDLSSVSDKEKEEQALFVKLSLYDSGPTEDEIMAMKVKRSLYETSGLSEEIDGSKMIAFDQDLEIKRSLYCSSSEDKVVREASKEEPGPSCSRRPTPGRYLRQGKVAAKIHIVKNKKRHQEFLQLLMSVESPPLTVPLLNLIVDYNRMKEKKDFDYQMFCCSVCFEEKMGLHCLELENCNHIFCRDCLTAFLNVSITEGKVKQLSCPETDCDAELLQSEIRSLVSPELFAKYDSLLLATTLDTLNVMYCPRKFCQYPVSPDNERMALCPQCDYCFCPYCKMVYHGVEPCRFKLDSEETKALIKEYETCSKSRKAELEKRYGRKHLQQLLDTSLSQSWISTNSKQCPKCNSSIERAYGCNKMVCLRCNTPFCWLCFQILDHFDPYKHFQTGRCAGKLYLGMEQGEDEEIDDGDLDNEFDEDEEFLEEYFEEGMRHFYNEIVFL